MILRWLNHRQKLFRWALKALFLVILVLLVLFPRVDRLPETVRRYLNPNDLVNPQSPALAPLIDEFEKERQPDWTRTELMNHIESFVYRKIPYARDWNLWANIDYIPTVEEAIKKGKEDCDGRAVVAASMLRRYGFEAVIVGNFEHIWVKTEIGETMGPAENKLVEYTAEGKRKFNWSTVWDMPDEFCYSISVFPLWRELIILVGVWLLLIGRGLSFRETLIWLGMLMAGLLLIRDGGKDSESLKNWAGILIILFSAVSLVVRSYRADKRLTPERS
jgi:hypothetical protein